MNSLQRFERLKAKVSMGEAGPRVAIACSGLGHIRRGIESWAEDLAGALNRRGIRTDLFSGAPGFGQPLRCIRRNSKLAGRILKVTRRLGGWRYAMGSLYQIEQLSFSINLWLRIRRGYDILHVQDPIVGRILDLAHRAGLSRPQVILANGTDEPIRSMQRMTHLQELTPNATLMWKGRPKHPLTVHVVPNFVDVEVYTPGDKAAVRYAMGLPADAYIVLSCAAIRRVHKRVDYLIQEFAAMAGRAGPADRPSLLLIAGGREAETDQIVTAGQRLLSDRVRFFVDVPRAQMADLYRAADVFALASLHEVFGIVFLEAMAVGLPVVCHDIPGFHYVVGPAGYYADLSLDGALADALEAMRRNETRDLRASAARTHVIAVFSESVVTSQVIAMYCDILLEGNPAPTLSEPVVADQATDRYRDILSKETPAATG